MTTKEKAPAGGDGEGQKEISPCTSNNTGAAGEKQVQANVAESYGEAVDGAALLEEIADNIGRFLSLPPGAADAVALWIMHAHAFDAADIAPRLAFTSPVPECGKTTALTLIAHLAPESVLASNASPAVVYRLIEQNRPTLLLDEAENRP